MDKRDRAALFRDRLSQAMSERGFTQSGLARAVRVDRSTISQLVASDLVRLPNAQVVAECAAVLGVSGDWLLGLSDLPEMATDILAASMQVTDAPRAPVDDQILLWYREAAGYKIRHVPAGLPDILKTERMLRWEYAPNLERKTDQVVRSSRDRLSLLHQQMSDFEIAMPIYQVEAMATCSGYYRDLPQDIRDEQMAHFQELHQALYPSLRVFLFDARRLWCAPLTVFGPLVAVLYLGQRYLAFRDRDRVGVFTRQFDELVREAYVSDRDWPDHLQALAASPR